MKTFSKILSLTLALLIAPGQAFAGLPAVEQQHVTPENLLSNGGFEGGRTRWTASGGTLTTTTTAANVGSGTTAGAWTATAGAQTLLSELVTVPSGLAGQSCLARANIQGGSGNLQLQARDGSGNVLGAATLQAFPQYRAAQVSFQCPASGQFRLGLVSTAASAIVYLDEAYLGRDFNVGDVQQATFFGSVNYPAAGSCIWSTTSGVWGNLAAVPACSNPTAEGSATAPGTKIPAIVFPLLPAGRYQFVVSGAFLKGAGATATSNFRISDGTSSSLAVATGASGTGDISVPGAVFNIENAVARSNVTFNVQAITNNASSAAQIRGDLADFTIQVYRFPTQGETVYRMDSAALQPAGEIMSFAGSACPTGWLAANGATVSRTAYPQLFARMGTAHGSGDGSTTFHLPDYRGRFLRGVDGGIGRDPDRTSRTASNTGGNTGDSVGSVQGSALANHSHNYFWNRADRAGLGAGAASYMLDPTVYGNTHSQGTSGASGTTSTETRPTNANVNYCVRAFDTTAAMPFIVGSVGTSSAGQERLERWASTSSDCTASPCVAATSTPGISSVTRTGTGAYTINFSPPFASDPVCVVTNVRGASNHNCTGTLTGSGATSLITCTVGNTGGAIDSRPSFICIGPR